MSADLARRIARAYLRAHGRTLSEVFVGFTGLVTYEGVQRVLPRIKAAERIGGLLTYTLLPENES